jgi:hypothetical protein
LRPSSGPQEAVAVAGIALICDTEWSPVQNAGRAPKGSMSTQNRRSCVIRDGPEVYVLRDHLTTDEPGDVEEREKSPVARRRFGVLLRRVRRIEDAPLMAALEVSPSEQHRPVVDHGINPTRTASARLQQIHWE